MLQNLMRVEQNVVMIKRFFFVILFITFGVLPVLSQTEKNVNPKSESFWINLPSSPLIIYEDDKPFQSYIKNVGAARISQYQFGCVKEENGLLVIESEKKPEDFYYGKNISEKFNYFPRVIHTGKYLASLCDKATKLTVIEVKFADGAKWTLKQ
jgi:hypothetical protein